MTQFFISYSRSDRQFIDQFVPLIRKVYGNDSVWFDDDLYGGANWWQTILSEVGRCDLFIYLISNESLESDYCQSELREALRLSKPILPVIVRRLSPAYPGRIDADLGDFLRETQYVDMASGVTDPNTLAALYRAVRLILTSGSQAHINTMMPLTPQSVLPRPKKLNTTKCALYAAGCFTLLAALIAGVFGLWQGVFANRDSPPSTETLSSSLVVPTASAMQTDFHTFTPTSESLFHTSTVTETSTSTETLIESATSPPSSAPTLVQQTVAPTNAQAVSTVWLPTLTDFIPRAFPCDASIRGNATVLWIVHSESNSRSSIVRRVRNGDVVRILDTALEAGRTRWYQIAERDSQPWGWVLSEYVHLSDNCPQ